MSTKTCNDDYRELVEKNGKGFIIKEVMGRTISSNNEQIGYISFTKRLIGKKVIIKLIK